jgi:hypothetical protein
VGDTSSGDSAGATTSAAIAATHEWFERNSGWAPPDHVTLAEWMGDEVCRCPDDCLVEPGGCCEHGLASWWLILTAIRRGAGPAAWDPALAVPHPARFDLSQREAPVVIAAHEEAIDAGSDGYRDPRTGWFVMTARYLWERGSCCESGCRHCPYLLLDSE